MKENCKFDERQLWGRGEVYKHMILVMGGLLILDGILKDGGVIWAGSFDSSMIILMISGMVGSVEMICRNVYMSRGNQNKWVVYLMGIISTISLVRIVIELIFQKYSLIASSQLNDKGFLFVIDVCMLVIFVVFIIKSANTKRIEKEENL
jgi:hypothetical protein